MVFLPLAPEIVRIESNGVEGGVGYFWIKWAPHDASEILSKLAVSHLGHQNHDRINVIVAFLPSIN